MLDNYASDQNRNWFSDEYLRVVYGHPSERGQSACIRSARLLSLACTLVASLFIFPLAAFHHINAATIDPLKDPATPRSAVWGTFLIFTISLFWVFLHLRFLPGRRFDGAVCGNGIRPTYKRNGFVFFLFTFVSVGILAWIWSRSIFELLSGLSLIFIVCCILASLAAYSKACLAPNASQCSAPSNIISDVFHGLELHPRVGELHLKQAVIRLGAVLNLVILWSCFFAQLSPSHAGSAIIGIQFLHAARRFWNEECYTHSMEVSHYKLGLREFYRHLVFKPFLLNLGTISNVYRPAPCAPTLLIPLCFLSATCIVLAYLVDRQKFLVKYKKGKCLTWGQLARTINAFYEDAHGLRRSSILLFSGFWGLARHLNYTLEFLTYCILAVPGLLNQNWFSAIPPGLILGSLLNRGREDFIKCRSKYGPYWDMYCERVPCAYLPGIL